MQQCFNTEGSYNCSCNQYFKTDPADWRKCVGKCHDDGLRSLRWLNVKQRLMVNDAVLMHKCLNGLSPSYLSDKFCTRSTIHDRQTRYRNTLNIPPCRIAAGQRAFCYRGVKIWNSLSTDLTQITDANIFKKRLIKSDWHVKLKL